MSKRDSFLKSRVKVDLHALRILSLSYAVLGVIRAASLEVHLASRLWH